jgi:hypothetical protein
MKEEDLRQLAERCRSLASDADGYTKKRLLDLALRYESMCEKHLDGPKVVSLSITNVSQPISVQSITIQSEARTDRNVS